ncbi:MAG: hypothetical protein EOM52_00585 [Clostridia bacterium]|nr:hypothetical protein [Clostridia bacterium]
MRRLWSLFTCLALLLVTAAPVCAVGVLTPLRCDWNFLSPTGVLLEEDGTLLVADGGLNHLVSVRGGAASLAAGRTLPYDSSGRPRGGHLDGTAALALFNTPCALEAWNGGVAVSDRDNHCVRLVSGGMVKTLAGDGTEGYRDGAAAEARFSMPLGLALGSDGTLYIADSGNGCIRAMDRKGMVTTYLSGLAEPAGLCWYGGALYVTDVGSHRIFRAENGKATLLAGRSSADGDILVGGFSDGPAADAEFSAPFGIAVGDGVIYVADTGNSAIRQIRDGWVSTLACYRGSAGDLWPGRPTELQLEWSTLYIADGFAGLVLQLDTEKQLFRDVDVDDTYARAVSCVYTNGLMRGVSGTAFAPGEPLTRGQAVTMLHRLAGQPEAEAAPYSDVTADLYCAQAVAWATANGLAAETGPGVFAPDKPITGGDLDALLARYRAWSGGMLEAGGKGPGGETVTRAQAAVLFAELLLPKTKF